MSDNRFGPAGIFSTDDPAADQRQIEAESYVDPLEEDGELWNEWDSQDNMESNPYEEEKIIRRVFACSTPQDFEDPWWSQEYFFESEEENVLAKLQQKHDAHCSCGNPIS